MEPTSTRSSNKLLNKFGALRKHKIRLARSDEALGKSPSPRQEAPILPAVKEYQAYTPFTIPERVASVETARREPSTFQSSFPVPYSSRQLDRPNTTHSQPNDQDGNSVGYSGFDDDLLQPRSPVLPLPATAIGARTVEEHYRSHELTPRIALSPEPEFVERGRSKRPAPSPVEATAVLPLHLPPTPDASSAKESTNGSSKPLEPPNPDAHVRSQSQSITAPVKLGTEALAQLQTPSADKSDVLETELTFDDNPDSWDIIKPNARSAKEWDTELYSLERRAEHLYSADHLQLILDDTSFHSKFANFLRRYRPTRLPLLKYYLDACKAIRALSYANSLIYSLDASNRCPPIDRAWPHPTAIANSKLHDAAQEAFDELLREDLHWYIVHTYIDIVRSVMQSRITGHLPAPLREASHGLAEVFCITDPHRRDNPIILASPAFTRHSGCNMDYILGRNCRFMQGPGTTVDSCRRFATAMEENRDHSEIFVNYRRDGSPFLSLVMNARLVDSRGDIRYYLGAQVDVSGLLKNCTGLDSLAQLTAQKADQKPDDSGISTGESESQKAMKALSEMLNGIELDIINRHGGLLHKNQSLHELQHCESSTESSTAQ